MESFPLSQFPIDTCIFLKSEARRILFGKLKKKFGSLRIAGIHIGIPGAELYSWQRGFSNKKKGAKVKRYVSLPALKLICKELNLSVDSLQKNVLEIKANSRGGLIKNPCLPLKIMPATFAVLGHFIGDGYGGESGNACYVNKSPEALQNFVEKLNLAFGDVEYTRLDKHYRVVVSKIVPKILKKYFEIKDFRAGKCILSGKLLNSSKHYLIEFLKALIIDEGRVSDSGIDLEFSPKAHLKHALKIVCKKLGYGFSHGKYFIISSKSFPVLRGDMGDLVVPKKVKC